MEAMLIKRIDETISEQNVKLMLCAVL